MSFPASPEDIDAEAIDKLCDSVRELADQIKVVFNNQLLEGSVSASDFQDLKSALEQSELDLEGSLHIVER